MRSPSLRGGRDWEALLEGREKSRVPPGGTIGVKESPQEGLEDWESLQEDWEGQESLPECQDGSGSTCEKPGGVGRDQESPRRDGRIGGPPGVLIGVGSPSWRVGKGWEAFLDGQKGRAGSESPARWLGGVGRPSRMAVRRREGSRVPQVGQDKREAFWRAGRGWEG